MHRGVTAQATPDTDVGPLAIIHGALGDTVLAAPALELLARAWGPLTVWGPALERLVPLRAPRGPAARARAFPPDALPLWGDAAPGDLPALRPFTRVVALCGPGPLATNVAAGGGVVVAAPRAGEPFPGHAAEVLLARVRAATGLAHEVDPRPRLRATPDDVARGRALAGAARYVVAMPGSGGRAKCMAPWRFARALEALPAALERVVVLGPAEVERGLDVTPFGPARVVRAPSMEDLIGLLAGTAAYVGNDAGPTHLAAALGTPVVAVFGPTDPARWGPRGVGPARIVQGDLDDLDPGRVGAALREVLGQGPNPVEPASGLG